MLAVLVLALAWWLMVGPPGPYQQSRHWGPDLHHAMEVAGPLHWQCLPELHQQWWSWGSCLDHLEVLSELHQQRWHWDSGLDRLEVVEHCCYPLQVVWPPLAAEGVQHWHCYQVGQCWHCLPELPQQH